MPPTADLKSFLVAAPVRDAAGVGDHAVSVPGQWKL
jgi:hypothetical protein